MPRQGGVGQAPATDSHLAHQGRKLAKEFGVSENTVKFHVRNILDKLYLYNRAQVVAFALRHGIVAPPAG
jgi:hypothetical protein